MTFGATAGEARSLWALAAAAAMLASCAGSDESDTGARAPAASPSPSETTPRPGDAAPKKRPPRASDTTAGLVPPGPPPERIPARDADTACALLDSRVKRQLAQLLRRAAEQGQAASPREPPSCASALGRLLKSQSPAGASQARRLRVTDARVKGNDGFAIFRMPGVRQGGYPVRRENGSWKVAGLGGVPLQ